MVEKKKKKLDPLYKDNSWNFFGMVVYKEKIIFVTFLV